MGSVLSSVGSVLSYFCSPSPLQSSSPSLLPLPSPSCSPEIKYDAFLSFGGKDTRNNFTAHLNKALRGKGIDTFIDEDGLHRGDEISPRLLQAIEESQISVVIFSPNYANSRWCLEELVKILECKKNHGQIVIPVFYEIDPSHVRHQTGSYAVAFTGHQRRFKKDLDKVQKWRCALTEAANLSGFDSLAIKSEAVLVDKIVEDVLKRLNNMSSSDNKQLIGIESKITKIEVILRMGDQTNDDVRKVGICGIGGIGKTTLAKAIFDDIYCLFEGFYFTDSIREALEKKKLKRLRENLYSAIFGDNNAYTYIFSKKRLHRKKLLIVFDDVTSSQQIEDLIRDLDHCCGSGSRFIITSRDRQALQNCKVEVEDIYMVKELCSNDALKLFCQHAFKQNRPKVEYKKLSKGVVKKVGGVPLALKVLGCFLLDKKIEVWESSMKKLENVLDKDIHKVLKISYDGLDHDQKRVFLDIACFYKGWDVNLVIDIMDASGFCTICELSALEDKCLIIKLDNKIMMHDLLQAMGKEIVRQESPDPGERTRLCNHNDVRDVLTKATGTKKIEGITLNMSNISDIPLHPDAFKEMQYLRFLQIWSNNYNKIHVPQDFKFCLIGLRYLQWKGYPLKSLQYLNNLVKLDLSESNIEQLWSGDQQFDYLKEIKLEGCPNLISFPNIRAPKLEVLNLRRCTSLIEMPSSFQDLTRLMYLIIPSCPNLTSVPELPVNLRELDLKWCLSLIELPSSFQRLTKLKSLDLRHCRSLTSIPNCTNLISLQLRGDYFFDRLGLRTLPKENSFSISCGLNLEGCSTLQRLPELPNNLVVINLEACSSLIEIPSSIQHLTRLTSLLLKHCRSLTSLPDCSGLMSLETLDLYGCSKLERLPEIPNNFLYLYFYGCTSLLEIPSSFQHLRKVRTLRFVGCESLTSIPDLTGLQSLISLTIHSCSKLQRLPELPNRITDLSLQKIPIEELPPSYEHLCTLLELHLIDCSRLKSPPSIFCAWKSLETLCLKNYPTAFAFSVSRYEDGVAGSLLLPIDFLHNLTQLSLSGCGITEIPDSVCCLTSLQRLELDRNNFERIPESIINLSKLSHLNISYCERLKVLPTLPWARIDALNCTSLQELSCPSFLNYPVSVFDPPCASFINCFKLDQNSLDSFVNTQLEIQAKSPSNVKVRGRERPTLAICYPGSEIPKQFTFQCSRSSIDVKLPWDYDFLCLALCAVVSIPDQCDTPSGRNLSVIYEYDVKSKKGGHRSMHGSLFSRYSLDYNVRSSHVFIGFGSHFLHQSHDDEFTFRFYSCGKDCKVEKCGVHLIFSTHLEVSDEVRIMSSLSDSIRVEKIARWKNVESIFSTHLEVSDKVRTEEVDKLYSEESEEEEDESYGEESEEEDNRMNRMVKNPRRRRKPINLY